MHSPRGYLVSILSLVDAATNIANYVGYAACRVHAEPAFLSPSDDGRLGTYGRYAFCMHHSIQDRTYTIGTYSLWHTQSLTGRIRNVNKVVRINNWICFLAQYNRCNYLVNIHLDHIYPYVLRWFL